MSIRSHWITFFVALVVMGASISARAATLQYVVPIAGASYVNLTGHGSETVTASTMVIDVPFTQYDPTVDGPLTSVNINFKTSYDLSFNNGTEGGGNSYNIGGNEFLNGHGYSGAGSGNGNGGAPGSSFDLPVNISDSTTLSNSADPAFQAVLGSGTATYEYLEDDDVTVASFTGGNAQFGRQSGGSLTITYTFVPEPASLGLLAVGSMVVVRRRAR